MWKIQEVRTLSLFFAKLVNSALKSEDFGVIVPIPPRHGKIAEKGWDQINELCNILKYRFGFRVEELLVRSSLKQQKKLDREDRLKSIGTSYGLKSPDVVLPDRVCLIDDVCTTGATLESCAKILRENGVKEVNAITLFTVD